MNTAKDLRAEWDRLIEDPEVCMTKVVMGPQAFRELMSDRDVDRSINCVKGIWTFRTLPIVRKFDYDGWKIETADGK